MDDRQWDVAILGGGIIGLGAARALTRAGYSVLVIERGLLGQGTSSHSHRIMHSGFRYLQNLRFGSLIESARSLQMLLHEFPACVQPLTCCMPLFSSYGIKSPAGMELARLSYATIVALAGLSRPQWGGIKGTLGTVHQELGDILSCTSVFQWQDGFLKDHPGIIANLSGEVGTAGTMIREHATVKQMRTLGTGGGYELAMQSPGAVDRIRARAVIDARGAGIDDRIPGAPEFPLHEWCLGFNIRLRRSQPLTDGIALPQQHQRRFLFLAPRDGKTVALGTGYQPLRGADLTVSEAEQGAFLRLLAPEVVSYVGSLEPQLVERGVLPRAVCRSGEVLPDARTVLRQSGNYLQIRAGKYTTFPAVADRLTRAMQRLIGPRSLPSSYVP